MDQTEKKNESVGLLSINEDPEFLFINELLNKKFKGVSVYTHLIDKCRKTKKGNPIYNLAIYASRSNRLLANYTAFKFVSKKTGVEYFSALVNESRSPK